MAKALRNYANRTVPQSEAISSNQVKNNAGGFTFEVSDKSRLERFLILGTDGGTYYVSESDLTKQNVDFLVELIKKDENLVLRTTVEVSKTGRAYRNDAAIFVLALLLAEGNNKEATVLAVSDVVRTGTHVYALADFITSLGGWGRAKRAAIANWFTSKTSDELAYQAVKYRQRNGWTMKDLMAKSHPKGINPLVGDFIVKGNISETDGLGVISGFGHIQKATSVIEVIRTLNTYPDLPWETIPTQFLSEKKVWLKLIENGQLRGQALVRQITRLAKIGLFDDMTLAQEYASLLCDEEMIRKTRLHPMQYLNAYVVYNQGQIQEGSSSSRGVDRVRSWTSSPIIRDALDDGFGLAFGNINSAGKRTMISIDTSASMTWYGAGGSQLDCRQAAGAMAAITARTEPMYIVNGFSGSMQNINISARDSLDAITSKISRAYAGGTDCAQPMIHAKDQRLSIDTFIIITDNETWSGYIHPSKALKDYRKSSGIPARLVVMAMTPTEFSIADPRDSGMLDVVGFDSNTPKVIADFSAGRI